MSPLRHDLADARLWVAEPVLRDLAAEASRRAPLETGGVLLGYWAAGTGDPVVTRGLGPGPNAVHHPTRFTPDDAYHADEIARLYAASGRRLCYLGDWHSHPGGGGGLSGRDRATLRRIARCRSARADRPVMLVLAGGPRWEAWGWRFVPAARWRLRRPERHVEVCPFPGGPSGDDD